MSLNASQVDADGYYLPNKFQFGWSFDTSDLRYSE